MDIVSQNVEKLKTAFGDEVFSGKDVARVLGTDVRGTGGIFKHMFKRKEVQRIMGGVYRFTKQEAPVEIATTPATIAPVVASETACNHPLTRIGEFLFHERVILIADKARQDGSDAIRLITSVLEYDTTFRAVRNKVINFTKSRDPREYAAMRAWLDGMAGVPPQAVDETALELAAELERKLNAANQEIAELKAKLEAIRGAL